MQACKKITSFLLVFTMVASMLVSVIPATTAYAAGETVSPTDAPYAGVYQVISDKAVILTNETGHRVSLLPGEPEYFYLIAGANDLTLSDASANLTFVALQGNGLDALNQVSVIEEPIPVGQEDLVVTFATKDEPHLDPGESYTFTYTPSKGMNGIVYPYLAFNDPNEYVLKITTDTGYQTTIFKPEGYPVISYAWEDSGKTDPALLYVRDGENTITIENISDTQSVIHAIRVHSGGELIGNSYWDAQMKMAELVVVPFSESGTIPTPIPTVAPTPTATPKPTYAPTGTMSYTAENAGIYRVTADQAVTLTNETGSTLTLAADDIGYLYLIQGDNEITTSNLSATVTFSKLSNYGMNYLSQIATSYIPYATQHTSFGDRLDVGIHNYLVGGEGTYSTETNDIGQYISLGAGASVTLQAEVSANGAGIVYPYLGVCDNKVHSFVVTSDTGFYAELMKNNTTGWQTTCWADGSAQMDMEFLYIREGTNTITIRNTGSNTATVASLRMSMTDGSDGVKNHVTWGSQINLVNLKVTEGAVVPSPGPTAEPTPTPPSVNPDVSDRVMRTVYQAENYASGSLLKTTYAGTSVAKAGSESNGSYTINVEEDTVFNLYMRGAAWKDVSFDISIDGTNYFYENMHFQSDRSATYSYNEECVATFPLSKGTHTLKFTFYCDTFYFDSFTLEDTYSKEYQILYGIKNMTTSQGIYEALLTSGDYIYIDVEADTQGLAYPPMAFWSMVGKEYDTPAELVALYEAALEEETAIPTVRIKDASNRVVTTLPEGRSTVTVNCSNIPRNTTLICAIYQGGKLAQIPKTASSTSTTVSFGLTDVEAGSTLKILAFSDMDEITPYTASGAYMDFYVAPDGKSANDGLSPETPLATVAQALTKVKSVNASMTGDIVIHVAPGVYRSNTTITIDPTMSGKNGYKVIIRGDDPDNRPVLSGGEPLTGKWSKVPGEEYWVATTTTRETRALYVNGYQATMARSDQWYWGDPITPSSPKNSSHKADGIKVSLSERPNISRELKGESRMQIVFNLAWANHRFPVDSVTYDSNYAYINTKYPYFNAYLLNNHTQTIMPIDLNGHIRAFYLENAMALLDEPGEFYFDKANRKMYYYPYANEDMTTAQTYCAVTDGLLTIGGVSSSSKVENLEFQNISFQHGAWDDATLYGAAFNQSDELRIGTETYYDQKMMHAQVLVSYADSVVFNGCEFACLGSSGIYFTEGVSNSKVIHSDFHDISGGGISVGNYLHNKTYDGKVERCSNIEIGDNIFRRCTQEFLGLNAVAVYYANGVNIHHNDIRNLGYTGIAVGWGWGYNASTQCGNHTVAYNKIQDCLQVLDDGAQVYTLCDQLNTHIMDNYFVDPDDFRRGGLYLDEGSGYIQICDNVFQNANDSGDFWLFARKNVHLNDNYAAYNHTDGGDPKYFATFPLDTAGVTYGSNHINVRTWSQTAERVMAEAGVEDKSRVAAIDYYPTWRTMRGVDKPADE